MSTVLSDIKTIMKFSVKEELKKTTESYGIVPSEKMYLHEEAKKWSSVEGENKCSSCLKRLLWKKEAQKGYRVLMNCNSCGLTKVSKERERTFSRTSHIEGEGDDDKKIFIETYSNKEIRMQTLYQSVCVLYNLFLGWTFKDTQAENAHPKEILREDKGFQTVKSRKAKKTKAATINLEKLSLLPGKVIAYYGIIDLLSRWRSQDEINLIIAKIGENIFISHARKVSRDNYQVTDKSYDVVTSTLRGVPLCLIAEIDERMDDGHPRELKRYAYCKNEGEKFPYVLSVAIKMILGNIRRLKINYKNTEDRFELIDGIFTSHKGERIDLTDEIASSFDDLADVLDEILKATKSGHSYYSISKSTGDEKLKIEPISERFDITKCLGDFQKLLKNSSQ